MSETTDTTQQISNNAAFKMRKGYSKTMHNLMRKYNCKTVEAYRAVRKANKAKKTSNNSPVLTQKPQGDERSKNTKKGLHR